MNQIPSVIPTRTSRKPRIASLGEHPAFAAMLAAATKHGLPRSFPTDLTVHDRREIEKWPAARRFAWFLFEAGTHLCWIDMGPTPDGRRARYRASGNPRATAGELCTAIADNDPQGKWYLWDGARLVEHVSVDGLCEAIACLDETADE